VLTSRPKNPLLNLPTRMCCYTITRNKKGSPPRAFLNPSPSAQNKSYKAHLLFPAKINAANINKTQIPHALRVGTSGFTVLVSHEFSATK